MQSDPLATPALLIIFNRPDASKRLLERLREIRPVRIFISADGPRSDKHGEKELCEKTRAVFDSIDWPCDIRKNYHEQNLGCDPHIISAVDWLFEYTESGIILEDDCLPDPTFFPFCATLLEKYKDDRRVMHINGSNFQFGNIRGNGSYYFSHYAHSWGWATWKRAWADFGTTKAFAPFSKDQKENRFWLNFFEKISAGKYPFWDARWLFTIWSEGGIVITPNSNLITNIGFGKEATHTSIEEKIMNQPTIPMKEIINPSSEEINAEGDAFTFKVYYYRTHLQKIIHKLNSLLN